MVKIANFVYVYICFNTIKNYQKKFFPSIIKDFRKILQTFQKFHSKICATEHINATHDYKLDHFGIKHIIGPAGKTQMKSED